MSTPNLTISFLVKLVNQTAAPLKGIVNDLTKLGKTADVTAKPLKAVSTAIQGTVAPAVQAGKSTEKYAYSLDRATRRTQAFIRLKMPAFLESIGNKAKLAALGLATVATFGAGAVVFGVNWVHSQAQVAEATLNAATAAGVNARSYQRLAYVFKSSNLDVATMDRSLQALNRRMVEARAGNKAAERPFKALHLAVKGVNGQYKEADVLLAEIADKFAGMKDGARKATLAQLLLGESGTDLIPLLNQGSKGFKEMADEGERLGHVLTRETLVASEKLNKKWDKLTNSVFGLQNSIWSGLIPSVGGLVDGFQDILDANRDDILKGMTSGVDWLKRNLPSVIKGVGEFSNGMLGIVKFAGDVTSAVGGIGNVFDILAGIMIGKMAWGLIGLTAQIWGVNTALYAFPGTWIVAAIAAVAFGAYLLVRHWKVVSKFFGDLWKWLKDNVGALPAVFQPFILIPAWIIDHWSEIKTFFTHLGDWLGKWFLQKPMEWWNSMPQWFRNILKGTLAISVPGGAALAPLMFGGPRGPGASAPAQSFRSQGASPTSTSFGGKLDISIDSSVPTRVTGMQTTPGFDLGVGRGLQGGF